jgi:hypothetical protein
MASAITLTNHIPIIREVFGNLDVISRERIGMIPAAAVNANASRLALNQTARIPIVGAQVVDDLTPATTAPDTGAQTPGTEDMSITKSRFANIPWSGVEEESVASPGPGHLSIKAKQFLQAYRQLVNEIELDLAVEAKVNASRAYGTAGTTPFAAGVGDSAQLLKILEDNGAPAGDLQMVVDTAAAALLRTNTQLTKANEAATDAALRRGELVDLHGFLIRVSGQIGAHTIGTGTGYLVDDATPLAVGDTVITVDTGSGTILAGDVVTFAADADNKYVVKTALSGSTFTIAEPGLRVSIPDDNAITVGAAYTANVGFDRNALQLLTRLPELPEDGDAAVDRMTVMDPLTGISFELAQYGEFRRVRYILAVNWGVAGIKREHTATLLG